MFVPFKNYYQEKYPHLNYYFKLPGGSSAIMYSIPANMLVGMYKARMGTAPESFFDCGAASGELLNQAEKLGMKAKGIDILKYPGAKGNVEIVHLLKYEKIIDADMAYCNGTLTYFNEENIGDALTKLGEAKMLIAIHNTAEDVEKSLKRYADDLTHGKPRLIKPQNWWMSRLTDAGFSVDYDDVCGCFCAISKRQH